MAKLSARGRTEVYRVSKADKDGAPVKLTLMSDGAILINFGYGWKVFGKLTLEMTQWAWLEACTRDGWVRE